MLALTDAGRGVLRGEGAAATAASRRSATRGERRAPRRRRRPIPGKASTATCSSGSARLRTELAAERGVPPYVVFGDAALRDMARRRPSTLEAFLDVRGVGEQQARRVRPRVRRRDRRLLHRRAASPSTSRRHPNPSGPLASAEGRRAAHAPRRPHRLRPRRVRPLPPRRVDRRSHAADWAAPARPSPATSASTCATSRCMDPSPWLDAATAQPHRSGDRSRSAPAASSRSSTTSAATCRTTTSASWPRASRIASRARAPTPLARLSICSIACASLPPRRPPVRCAPAHRARSGRPPTAHPSPRARCDAPRAPAGRRRLRRGCRPASPGRSCGRGSRRCRVTPATAAAVARIRASVSSAGAASSTSASAPRSSRTPLNAISPHAASAAQSSADSYPRPPHSAIADADHRGQRRERIAAMMPGVALDGAAVDLAAGAHQPAKQQLLGRHDDHQHGSVHGAGRLVRLEDLAHALHRQHRRRRRSGPRRSTARRAPRPCRSRREIAGWDRSPRSSARPTRPAS